MRLPVILFVLSIAVAGVATQAAGFESLFLIAFLAAMASLVLILLAGLKTVSRGKRDARQVIIDGSNVMYWRDNVPDLASLEAVIALLRGLGYKPRVIFDANAGYLVAGGYRHDAAFAHMLGLAAADVMVVPKGMPADGFILQAAKAAGLQVVSNDRYRDWEDQHPEIRMAGRLVRGEWRNGGPWLDLDALGGQQGAA